MTLRFVRPVRTARGEFLERLSVILELRDTEGAVGYGEAAPWPGFGTETVEQSLEILSEVARPLVGAALDLDGAPLHVVRSLAPSGEFAARLSAAPAARAALEGALWDLAARRAGQRLADFLAARLPGPPPAGMVESRLRSSADPFDRPMPVAGAGRALTQVAASALLVATTPDTLREEASQVRGAGYRAAKLKLGASTLADDVARATAAREGLGPDIELRGDANGAWSERQAREALEALAPFRFAYVEQPLPAEAVDGLERLHRDSPVYIAADESVATEAGAARLLAAHAVDVVVLKPASLGGPARALAVAARARRAGCQVVFTHAFESAVGARHALHCAAAWGDAAIAHGVGTAGLFEQDVTEPVAVHAGLADVSPGAGLGIHL